MISRRHFLLGSAAGLLHAQGASAQVRVASQTNAWAIDPKDFSQFLAVLDKLRELEFQGFETSYRNLRPHFEDPEAARRKIEEKGLQLLGVHIFLREYDPETGIAPWELIREVADGSAAFGAQQVILSGRGVAGDGELDRGFLARKIKALAKAGDYCAGKGMILSYHNHTGEFQSRPWEMRRLLEETDPEKFRLLLDTGHAARAGVDVVEFFGEWSARISGMHLRDLRGQEQVPLGQGELDLTALKQSVRESGWKGWLIVEEERPGGGRPGDEAVIPARRHIKKVFGV